MTVWVLLLCLLVLPWVGAELLGRRTGQVAAPVGARVAPAQHRHTPPDPERWWYDPPAR